MPAGGSFYDHGTTRKERPALFADVSLCMFYVLLCNDGGLSGASGTGGRTPFRPCHGRPRTHFPDRISGRNPVTRRLTAARYGTSDRPGYIHDGKAAAARRCFYMFLQLHYAGQHTEACVLERRALCAENYTSGTGIETVYVPKPIRHRHENLCGSACKF